MIFRRKCGDIKTRPKNPLLWSNFGELRNVLRKKNCKKIEYVLKCRLCFGQVRACSERFLEDLESRWQESVLLSGICDIVRRHARHHFQVMCAGVTSGFLLTLLPVHGWATSGFIYEVTAVIWCRSFRSMMLNFLHLIQYVTLLCFKGTGTRDLIWLKVVSLDRYWLVGLTDDL